MSNCDRTRSRHEALNSWNADSKLETLGSGSESNGAYIRDAHFFLDGTVLSICCRPPVMPLALSRFSQAL